MPEKDGWTKKMLGISLTFYVKKLVTKVLSINEHSHTKINNERMYLCVLGEKMIFCMKNLVDDVTCTQLTS